MGEKFFKKATLIVFTLFFAVVVCGAASAANADVQVNQTVNNTAPNYGDNVKFTDTVSNNGPNNATGVQVTDKLPTGLIYVSDDSNGAYNYSTGIWNVGNLNYGTTKSLNIIAKVNETGTIKNTASKTAENETDPNLNNDAQQTVLNVPKAVDISVDQYSWYPTGTYTCDNTPVFVVDVRNEGNDDATNVIVSYKVGNGYEYIGANTRGVGTATYNAATRTVTWTIPYMPKGTTDTPEAIAFMNVYLRIIETGTKTTDLTNTATLTSVDQHDTNTANNQTSAAITVPTSHDVAVNQTCKTDSSGKYVTYTITATNNGPDNATGVTIKDLLPSGLSYESDTGNGAYDPSTGIWNIGNLSNGATEVLNITALITATTGTIINTAALTAPLSPNFIDWNYDNNAQTTALVLSGTYTPNVDISVDQYSWYPTGTYTCDNTPVFVVDVRNEGNDDATNVIVSYKVGNGYEYIGANTRGVGTATYNAATRTVTWTIPYMPKGTTDTPEAIAFMNVYLRIIETGTKTTDLTNTATLTSVDQHDTNTANNQTSAAITVPTSADIQVNQNVTGTPNYNGTVTITVTAANNGPNNSTGVTIKDLLPSGLQYVSSTASQGTYDPTTGIWSLGNFTYGTEPQTLTIVAKIISTGTIKNVASLTAPLVPNFTDWNYDNNAQQCILTVPDAADVQVNQTVSSTTPSWNSTVVLGTTVKNNGPDTANNVQVTSLLPKELKYVSATPSQGTYDPTTGIWNIGTILNGQSVTLNITAIVVGAGSINNTANKTGENEYDWNNTNNQQTVNLRVPVPTTQADIQVTQTTDKTSYNIGDTVTITVTVKNNGSSRATGVQITGILPSGLTYSSSSTSTGSYNNSTGIWNIGTMRNGRSYTLTITAIATALGNITNTAFKSAETQYDQNLSNDAQSVTVNVANQVTHFTDDGTPTGTVNTDDGTTSAIKLPFNVTLYGQTYNTIYINVNGLVSFGSPVTGPYFSQTPTTDIAYVAPFWTDIDVTYAGNITYNITGNQVVITWSKVPGYSEGSKPTSFDTFSLIMTSDGKFAFVYGDMQWKNDPSNWDSYAMISNGNGTTKTFWTGAQNLSTIANSTIWFDSNGNLI